MRQRGSISFVVVAGIASIILVAAFMFMSRESPSSVAGKFMDGLARGDVDRLVELSHMPNKSEEDLRKEWERSLEAGKYLSFSWRIKGVQQVSDDLASVLIDFTLDHRNPTAYPENMRLPMVRIDGEWKVSVREMPRSFIPALPR